MRESVDGEEGKLEAAPTRNLGETVLPREETPSPGGPEALSAENLKQCKPARSSLLFIITVLQS